MARWSLASYKCIVTGGSKGLGLACVEELLKAGADPAATDSTGDTPFACAASRAPAAAAGPLAPHAPPPASLSLRVGRERVGEPRCLTQNA